MMFKQQTLHQLIATKDWTAVQEKCSSNPRDARKVANCEFLNDGMRKSKALPLHFACAIGAPNDVVLALISAYDKGTEHKETAYKRLPLHTALHNMAHQDIILALIQENPGALNVADDLGRLPIHYAIANGASMKVISELLKLEPKATHTADYRGWTPLHVACGVGAPPAVIKRLLKTNPDAVYALSNADETPLCFAQNFKTPNEDVVALLEEASDKLEEASDSLRKESPQITFDVKKKKSTRRSRRGARVGELV